MDSSFACLTPIPETSGFASIDKGGLEVEQVSKVGRVQPAAMSSKTPRVIGNRVLHKHTDFVRFITGQNYTWSSVGIQFIEKRS